MGSALKIRDDLTPLELRRWARVESYGRAAARAYGIANALEEMPRADAARLAGMDRQTLRDAVVRYNAKGLEGLHDRPKGYSPRRLTADEEAALAAVTVPDNVTLALLPPYSPELNPVERVWLYLRERFLSLRVLDDTEAIIDACCQAWIDLIAEPDRMRTLCAYPWIMKVIS